MGRFGRIAVDGLCLAMLYRPLAYWPWLHQTAMPSLVRLKLSNGMLPMAHQGAIGPARACLFWALVSILAIQVGVNLALERWLADVRDPYFAAKLERLRARLAAAPPKPLVLCLGSSRTLLGLEAG